MHAHTYKRLTVPAELRLSRVIKKKSILCIAPSADMERIFTPEFKQLHNPVLIHPDAVPEELAAELQPVLMVVAGYSLKEMYKQMPRLETLMAGLAERIPRLYLLESTDPTLALVPLKGDRRFFYLRGPLSLRSLRNAIDQILAMKPRPLRFPLTLEQGINARFTLGTGEAQQSYFKQIEEISPTGFSFRWEITAPLIYPGDRLEQVELRAHERLFLSTVARVKHLTPLRDAKGTNGLRVGVEFVDIDLNQGEPNRQDQPAQAFLSDPLVIRTVIADAVERDTEIIVVSESQTWSRVGAMSSFDALLQEITLKLPAPIDQEELHRLDIMSCQFVRDNSRLQFSSVILSLDVAQSSLTLRLPRRLDKLWSRSTLRHHFPDEGAPMVEVHSPIDPGRPMRRKVLNLSSNGLSFAADARADLLFKGMHLDRIDVLLPNGPRISVAAEVRYLGPRSSESGRPQIPCGVRFVNVPPSDHHQLVNYLISKNFPLVADGCPADEDPLWKFLEQGEFLTPAKQEECIGSMSEIRDTQRRMLNAPPGFSRKLVFQDEGRIYGTVSLQQIYSQTWLVHHLCATRHPVEFVPKQLLLFLGEYISKTPEIQFVKMMWRPNNTWSNKMFGRLVHRLHDGEQSVVKVYTYLHRELTTLPPLSEAQRAWTIRAIRPDEILELESYFIRNEEFFLMKSEDLLRGRLSLDGLDARYRALGLFRERETLVAFHEGRLAGFCLMERSSPGLNMSNLLNTFQVFVHLTDAQRASSLRQALIWHASRHYQAHGQAHAVAMTTELSLTDFEEQGYSKVKEYVSWTFDHNIANIYNLYCYYIFRLYERLELKRQARRAHYHGRDSSLTHRSEPWQDI